jgi:hypothetical protein
MRRDAAFRPQKASISSRALLAPPAGDHRRIRGRVFLKALCRKLPEWPRASGSHWVHDPIHSSIMARGKAEQHGRGRQLGIDRTQTA